MSDEATGATLEAPPVEPTEVQEAPAAPEPGPELAAPKNKQEARRNVAKRAAALAERAERAVQDADAAEAARARHRDQPRVEAGTPEGGQFKAEDKPGEGSPDESTSAAGDLPAPGETDSSEASQGATEDPVVDQSAAGDGAPPAGQVDIPLPDGHPLRDRGLTHLRVAAEHEQEARAGVNAIAERRELRDTLEAERRERALLEARQKALTGDVKPYETDYVYQQLLEQIRGAEGFGDEVAEEVKAALDALNASRVRSAEQEVEVQFEQQRIVGQWSDQVMHAASQMLTAWSGEMPQRLNPLMVEYCDAVDARNQKDGTNRRPDVREFFEWIKPVYSADPRVRQQIDNLKKTDQETERERIRREERAKLEAEARDKAEEAQARHSVRPPLSRKGSASTRPVTETPDERAAPRGPGTLRKDAKARIRQRYG